jgi:serine phosphatase RsbU (regulator of sigma subunit)
VYYRDKNLEMSATEQDHIENLIHEVDAANKKMWETRGSPDFDPEKLVRDTFEKASSINYEFGIAQCRLNSGMGIFIRHHNGSEAMRMMNEALDIFKKLDDKKWMANTHLTMGIINNSMGNTEVALYNALKGADFYEHNPDAMDDRVMCYYIVGTVYKDLKKYAESEKFYLKGIEANATNPGTWNGRIYTGLATVYSDLQKYPKALEFSFKGLERLKEEKNHIGESRALTDIGVIYKKLKNYSEAKKYLFEGLKIRESYQFKQFVVTSHLEIASLFSELRERESAIEHYSKAEKIATEIKQIPKLAVIYKELARIYKSVPDFQKALSYSEKLLELNNELNNKEIQTRIKSLHESLVKEKEDEIERLRNVELKNAYHLISEKNKEITDSINYARRIQFGILPTEEDLKNCFENYFVFYRPKDIVSGDFYWATQSPLAQSGKKLSYIAAVDCTGHGVPGAFMSMLGTTLLNQTINDPLIIYPAQILNYLNQELPKNLKSYEQDVSIRDGMDISLCAFDFAAKKLFFAGANNPCWIIRNGDLIELKANKQAISAGTDLEKQDFTNHEFDLQANDCVYLLTDGFADQFGGPKGKKFKYRQLADLLRSISNEELKKQVEILDERFSEWKGDLEQIDDVCIIAVKI